MDTARLEYGFLYDLLHFDMSAVGRNRNIRGV